jgi:hypothetical protein
MRIDSSLLLLVLSSVTGLYQRWEMAEGVGLSQLPSPIELEEFPQ